MRGEDDRGAARSGLLHQIRDQDAVDGVEAFERFVKDDELGFGKHDGGDLNFLLHALRELSHAFPDHLWKAYPV